MQLPAHSLVEVDVVAVAGAFAVNPAVVALGCFCGCCRKPARYRLVLTVIRMVIVIDIVIVFNKLVIYCFLLLLLPSLATSLRFEYLLSRGTMPAIIALGHHVLHFPCYMYKG